MWKSSHLRKENYTFYLAINVYLRWYKALALSHYSPPAMARPPYLHLSLPPDNSLLCWNPSLASNPTPGNNWHCVLRIIQITTSLQLHSLPRNVWKAVSLAFIFPFLVHLRPLSQQLSIVHNACIPTWWYEPLTLTNTPLLDMRTPYLQLVDWD